MKQAKLIDCRSEGTKNYYSLSHDTTKIEQLQQLLTHITSIMPGGSKHEKILVVLTNVSRYHGTEEPTGLWLGEATEFVEEVTKAGFSVDYVSPQGGYVPLDPRSMKYVDSSIMAVYESADFQERALAHSSLEEIEPDEYAAIYFTGGHGVMWDFPDNPQLQAITRSLYEQGKYLTSVCHGIAGLLNVKDASGNYLIADKTITGFTTAEEILAMKKQLFLS